jgi:hypothetical protein
VVFALFTADDCAKAGLATMAADPAMNARRDGVFGENLDIRTLRCVEFLKFRPEIIARKTHLQIKPALRRMSRVMCVCIATRPRVDGEKHLE